MAKIDRKYSEIASIRGTREFFCRNLTFTLPVSIEKSIEPEVFINEIREVGTKERPANKCVFVGHETGKSVHVE